LDLKVSSSKVSSCSQFTSSFGIGEVDREAKIVVEVVTCELKRLFFEAHVYLYLRVVTYVDATTNEVDV